MVCTLPDTVDILLFGKEIVFDLYSSFFGGHDLKLNNFAAFSK